MVMVVAIVIMHDGCDSDGDHDGCDVRESDDLVN